MKTLLLKNISVCAIFAGVLVPSANADLVVHYKFDETSGQTAVDSAGADQNLVTSNGGVGWTAGLIGNAVNLTQDVMVSHNVSSGTVTPTSNYATGAIGNGDSFTMSAWINEADGQSGYRGIFTTGTGDVDFAGGVNDVDVSGTTTDENWGLNLEATRRADIRANTTGGSNGIDIGTVVGDTWHHLVLVHTDGVGSVAYFDGVASPVFTGSTDFGGENQFWQLGTDRNNNGRRFTGLVDDLAIWNEALTSEQVTNIYNGGLNGIDAATAVPEPSSFAVLALCGMGAALRRRRK